MTAKHSRSVSPSERLELLAIKLKAGAKCEILARSTLARGPRQEGSTRQSGAWRSLASALDWGSRGRRFKSCRPDFGLIASPSARVRRGAFVFVGNELHRDRARFKSSAWIGEFSSA
jgi:hypothetical protein